MNKEHKDHDNHWIKSICAGRGHTMFVFFLILNC